MGRGWIAVALVTVAACGRVGFGEDVDAPLAAIDAGDAGGCAGYACSIDTEAATTTCSGAVAATVSNTQALATITMTGRAQLGFTATVCDPTGWSLHFADSPTNDGGGGDTGSTSNDAESYVENDDFFVVGNDYQPGNLLARPGFVQVVGCTVLAGRLLDQQVHVSGTPDADVMSPYALRLDPPMDMEGTPDAIWYVGVNRTFGSAVRSGTGLRRIDFCLD